MADMNGEAAFLAAMAGDEYDPAHQQLEPDMPEEEEDDDDYDPSSFMPDVPAVAADNADNADSASIAASATPQHEAPSQPPSQAPSQAPSRTTSTQPISAIQTAQKPKTIGGFIEEDDDEDDEEEAQNATAQNGANGALAVASQNTPLQSPHRSLTQVYNASKDAATDHVVPNGHGAAMPESVSTPTSFVQNQGAPADQKPATPATPAPQPSAQSLPISSSNSTAQKPRLPQDRIGQLEDRIAEDPKGDINAWLELVNLHRQKGKLDDARQVYERFFDVFPTAVSSAAFLTSTMHKLIYMARVSNGSPLQTWSSNKTTSTIWNKSSTRPFSATTTSNSGPFTSITSGVATTS